MQEKLLGLAALVLACLSLPFQWLDSRIDYSSRWHSLRGHPVRHNLWGWYCPTCKLGVPVERRLPTPKPPGRFLP